MPGGGGLGGGGGGVGEYIKMIFLQENERKPSWLKATNDGNSDEDSTNDGDRDDDSTNDGDRDKTVPMMVTLW